MSHNSRCHCVDLPSGMTTELPASPSLPPPSHSLADPRFFATFAANCSIGWGGTARSPVAHNCNAFFAAPPSHTSPSSLPLYSLHKCNIYSASYRWSCFSARLSFELVRRGSLAAPLVQQSQRVSVCPLSPPFSPSLQLLFLCPKPINRVKVVQSFSAPAPALPSLSLSLSVIFRSVPLPSSPCLSSSLSSTLFFSLLHSFPFIIVLTILMNAASILINANNWAKQRSEPFATCHAVLLQRRDAHTASKITGFLVLGGCWAPASVQGEQLPLHSSALQCGTPQFCMPRMLYGAHLGIQSAVSGEGAGRETKREEGDEFPLFT